MGQRISGSGVGLLPPSFLYPSEINVTNTPVDLGNAYQTLQPGQALAVPEGSYYIQGGSYCVMQDKDPINNIWRGLSSARQFPNYVISDGFNYRIANLTGCPVAAIVTNAGSGYPSNTTVVASGSGGSTWQAVVGGMLSVSSVVAAGSGYGIPPLLCISAPPSPGVQATGYCTMVSGTVASVTLDNVGGGYTTPPTAVIVPSPYDPNLGNTITNASVSLAVVGSGSIAAVLCTNPGNSVAAVPTLTVSGTGGSNATVVAVQLTTFVSGTIASSGTWTGGAAMTSVGGQPTTTSAVTNPAISATGFIPRPVQALLGGPSNTLSSVSAIYDHGLFLGTPDFIVSAVSGALTPASTTTVTATYGGINDTVKLQPAP